MIIIRSILIFPQISSLANVQHVRSLYDPLATHIRPHISLIFPFRSELSNQNIISAIKSSVRFIKPFKTTFNKLGHDNNGYIWLEATQGKDQLINLHDELYQHKYFSSFLRKDIPYAPHITLGKVREEKVEEILNTIQLTNIQFVTKIESISVEKILPNDDSDEFCQIML